MNIPEALTVVMKLAKYDKVVPITKFDNCWERQIDDNWFIAFNGHKENKLTSTKVEVLGFTCYVEFNGFPAGIIDPSGGIIAAGEIANEDTFIEAIEGILNVS